MVETVLAPAKLTLSLRITGVRNDGNHLIDAEMASLSLYDTLLIESSGGGLSATGRYAVGMPLDDSNLVAKALRLVRRTAHVSIAKQIPHGGGLGGGSSDAAAVLRWAGFTDLEAASRLGADVSFCLIGGRSRVRGIGECVDPLPFVEQLITLVIPPLTVSTPAAYRCWDELGGPTAEGSNDLEPAAIRLVPELADWRDRIAQACGQIPVLAGSGATWFVYGEHSNALAALSNEGAEIIAARTVRSAADGSEDRPAEVGNGSPGSRTVD